MLLAKRHEMGHMFLYQSDIFVTCMPTTCNKISPVSHVQKEKDEEDDWCMIDGDKWWFMIVDGLLTFFDVDTEQHKPEFVFLFVYVHSLFPFASR